MFFRSINGRFKFHLIYDEKQEATVVEILYMCINENLLEKLFSLFIFVKNQLRWKMKMNNKNKTDYFCEFMRNITV